MILNNCVKCLTGERRKKNYYTNNNPISKSCVLRSKNEQEKLNKYNKTGPFLTQTNHSNQMLICTREINYGFDWRAMATIR